jgi:hypothetical protein
MKYELYYLSVRDMQVDLKIFRSVACTVPILCNPDLIYQWFKVKVDAVP